MTDATADQLALAACRAYVRASKAVKALTGQIGDALNRCPGTGDFDYDRGGIDIPRTHQREAYQTGLRKANAAMDACPHCAEAHRLVQERKKARLTLGAAKRMITIIGRLK
jgi:hypothetical protein